MIKGTGSKASDSPGSAERRMGVSHRYTQTGSCKPSLGKPRALQTCQVSTSESIFLPETLPNTPLSLRAKPKPWFVSLPCITVGSRWVFGTWQQGEKADRATGKMTAPRHHKSLQMRYRELASAFFHPYFLTDILCRPSWVVEGEGQFSCWHTVFLEVTGLPSYQTPAYLLNKSLLNIKPLLSVKTGALQILPLSRSQTILFVPKQTVSLSPPLKLVTFSRYLS